MRPLKKYDFLLRFAGGFAFGAVALIGLQPGALHTHLTAWVGAAAHLAL